MPTVDPCGVAGFANQPRTDTVGLRGVFAQKHSQFIRRQIHWDVEEVNDATGAKFALSYGAVSAVLHVGIESTIDEFLYRPQLRRYFVLALPLRRTSSLKHIRRPGAV